MRLGQGLLWLGALPILLASLAGLLGGLHWLPALVPHFRPHLALLALGLLLLALLLRRRRAALLLALALAVNAWPVWTAVQARAVPEGGGAGIRVAVWNLYYQNHQAAALAPALLALEADILFLTEVSDLQAPLIRALEAAYPYRLLPEPAANWGDALFSRFPPLAEVQAEGPERTPLWRVELSLPGGSLTLLAGHPLPAVSDRGEAFQAEWYAAAEAALAAHPAGQPLVLLGDFNAAPWSPRLAGLLSAGDLRWVGDGLATWPAGRSRLAGLPIDHVLLSPEMTLLGFQVLALPASDHRALLADLRRPMQE